MKKERKVEKCMLTMCLQNEKTYISWGLFEDIFLNNFVVELRLEEKVTQKSLIFFSPKTFDHKFDSRGVFVRYDDLFIDIQTYTLNCKNPYLTF